MGRETDRNTRLADYIYNDMRMEEVVEMENEIASDPQWSDAYRLNVEVKEYLQSKLQLEEMRSDPQLEDAEKLAELAFASLPQEPQAQESKPIVSKRNRTRRLSIVTALAASIALIIAFGIRPSMQNEDALFERFYVSYAASDNLQRGISTNPLYRDMAVGINHYQDGNYQQSIDQFESLISVPSVQSDVLFYSALSHMGLGQFAMAQDLFKSLLESESKYQASALWYLSLSCLKTGDFGRADAPLEQLAAYDGLYQKDSQALRRKLRRLIP